MRWMAPRSQNVEKTNLSKRITAQGSVIRVLTMSSNEDVFQGRYLSPLHDDRCVVKGVVSGQFQLDKVAGQHGKYVTFYGKWPDSDIFVG